MAEDSNRESHERRYLLGTLSDGDESRLEEVFFEDDAKFEELEIVEAELIDSYLHQDLSPEEQKRFEAKLRVSPRLVQQVQFAKLLQDKAAETYDSQQDAQVQPVPAIIRPDSKSTTRWWAGFLSQPAYSYAVAMGLLVVVGCGISLFVGWRDLRNRSNQLASERAILEQQKRELDEKAAKENPSPDQLPTQPLPDHEQQVQAPDPSPKEEILLRRAYATALLLLSPGSVRGVGGQSELRIGAEITKVQLKLFLENDVYLRYNAEVNNADGALIHRRNNLQAHKSGLESSLTLSIPAQKLPAASYVVNVSGLRSSGQLESVADYSFQILQKK